MKAKLQGTTVNAYKQKRKKRNRIILKRYTVFSKQWQTWKPGRRDSMPVTGIPKKERRAMEQSKQFKVQLRSARAATWSQCAAVSEPHPAHQGERRCEARRLHNVLAKWLFLLPFCVSMWPSTLPRRRTERPQGFRTQSEARWRM